MRPPARRADDADVIRARLRALLAEVGADRDDPGAGWLPDDDPETWPVLTDGSAGADRQVLDEPVAGTGLPEGIGRHRSPGRTARWDPGHPGARSLWIAAALAALLLVGWTWLDRPRVQPAPEEGAHVEAETSAAPPVGEAAGTSDVVVVSVVGSVARPGLVSVPAGARVADAIAAAGGLLPEADPASVNLAAVLSDGQQIAVGLPGASNGGGSDAPAQQGAGGGLVDLNTATVDELDELPGIGPVLAQRIVAHRTEQGPFRSVEELDDVPGIGPTLFAELSGLVTV
ncbi:ComEA family DNA-binding protein [Blastococcus sp. TF02A-30]|uniref:ComEA family DNA-binding protein n=1 Tax=Blastococcus sp. TF02A-30 TaxID=2250580 RepID=UPI000DEAE805|nr:ComEA family DNA-binding protein [Blastococcus sp. TF02A-30]RBY84885.1 competence protein ComEA [Blastococcus sp. TF02A-30]